MYYTREIAPLWLAYGEVKVLKKAKILKKVRKKKRNQVKGHELGKPSSLLSEKEDKSDLKIKKKILTSGKADPSLGYNHLVK